MAKAVSGISNDTKRQLEWTQKHNIPIGYINYWNNGPDKQPMFLNYKGNEEYWEGLEQISIRQTEFASLDIGYMFYKDRTLSKNNPYIYKDAWVNFGVNQKTGEIRQKPLAAFQQLWTDRISCKILADGETIDEIKAIKYVDDVSDILYIFDEIEKYNVELNVPKTARKVIYTAKGSQEIEITNIEDYDQDWELEASWKDINYMVTQDKEWYRNYKRVELLEAKVDTYKSRVKPEFTKFANILIKQYPDLKLYEALPEKTWIFGEEYPEGLGPKDLSNDIEKLSKKYNATYTSLWQTWYNYIIPKIEKEIKYLEEQLL